MGGFAASQDFFIRNIKRFPNRSGVEDKCSNAALLMGGKERGLHWKRFLCDLHLLQGLVLSVLKMGRNFHQEKF